MILEIYQVDILQLYVITETIIVNHLPPIGRSN